MIVLKVYVKLFKLQCCMDLHIRLSMMSWLKWVQTPTLFVLHVNVDIQSSICLLKGIFIYLSNIWSNSQVLEQIVREIISLDYVLTACSIGQVIKWIPSLPSIDKFPFDSCRLKGKYRSAHSLSVSVEEERDLFSSSDLFPLLSRPILASLRTIWPVRQ